MLSLSRTPQVFCSKLLALQPTAEDIYSVLCLPHSNTLYHVGNLVSTRQIFLSYVTIEKNIFHYVLVKVFYIRLIKSFVICFANYCTNSHIAHKILSECFEMW